MATDAFDDLLAPLAEYVAAARQNATPKRSRRSAPNRLEMRFPAELRAGDVFTVGDSEPLTYVSSTVKLSQPTIGRLKVKERVEPLELNVFDETPAIRMISRGCVDPIFAGGRKGTAHLFVPLTDDHARCGECGDVNTANHVVLPGPSPTAEVSEFSRRVAALTKPGDLPGRGYVSPFEVADGVRARCGPRRRNLTCSADWRTHSGHPDQSSWGNLTGRVTPTRLGLVTP